MSRAGILVRKELRALAGVWLATAATLVACALPSLRNYRDLGLAAYVGGAAALGAVAIGHEIRLGTLPHLLAQPVSRWRVLVTKMSIVLLLVVALCGLAQMSAFAVLNWDGPERAGIVTLFALPPLYGVLVAPWLTLKTRSALAGMLFSASLPVLFCLLANPRAVVHAGPGGLPAFNLAVTWAGSIVLFVIGGIGLWRSFVRFEMLDGPVASMERPAASRAVSGPTRRNRFLLLAGKELRLQQLTFAVSASYAIGHTVMRFTSVRADGLILASLIDAIVIAAVVGSLACAGERETGALEGQLLQPISTRVQFAIKFSVALAVTLVLALGVPMLLGSTVGGIDPWAVPHRPRDIFNLVLLLSGSLYVSSLAPSGVIALFACVPAYLAARLSMVAIAEQASGRAFTYFRKLPAGGFDHAVHPSAALVNLVGGCGLVILILWFAAENHRDAGRSFARASRQLGLVALALTVVYAALGATGQFN